MTKHTNYNISTTALNTKSTNTKRICFIGDVFSPTATGRVLKQILNISKKLEIAVAYKLRKSYLHQKNLRIPSFINKLLNRPDSGKIRLHILPLFALPSKIELGDFYAVTWFDAENPPNNLKQKVKNIKKIWLPSQKHIEQCIKNGIAPHKLNLMNFAVDTKIFNRQAKNIKTTTKNWFKFICVLSPLKRKGLNHILQAYLEEFKPEEPVELIIKLTHLPKEKKQLPYEINNLKKRLGSLNNLFAKVTIIAETIEDKELSALLAASNVFISANYSYNTALSVKEAMACGLPVIGNFHLLQPLTGINKNSLFDIATKEAYTKENELYPGSNSQLITLPNIEDLKKAMRYAFKHKKLCKKMGLEAHRIINKQPNWKESVLSLLAEK